MPSRNLPQLEELLSNLVDEKLGQTELKELQALLREDPEARQFYIKYTMMHSWLAWDHVAQSPAESRLLSLNNQVDADELPKSTGLGFLADIAQQGIQFLNNYSPLSFLLLFVMFGLAIYGMSYWLSNRNTVIDSVEPVYVAQITVMQNCQWAASSTPLTEKMQLAAGQHLQLEKGLARITYSNQAEVLLEGPVSFTVDSHNSGFLGKGKLTAKADTKQSRSFTVSTPNARFVDLGTEFGVSIDSKGRSAVAVFEGKVNAEAKLTNGRWTPPVSLRKGEAVVCEGAKFTHQLVKRKDYPNLQPAPPPSPSYFRWLDASRSLRSRQDLVAYYDFQLDPNQPGVLLNRAPTGAMYNGTIHNAEWVEGRFAEKNALDFMAEDSGVQVNLPGEYQQMTLIAWVNINQLKNPYQSILMSDDWERQKELHWEIRKDGNIFACVFGQDLSEDSVHKITPDSLNKWCMIALVINGPNQISLYVNGKYIENLNASKIPAIQINSATIGGWNNKGRGNSEFGPVYNLCGRMDELLIFQITLSSEEISQIFKSGKP